MDNGRSCPERWSYSKSSWNPSLATCCSWLCLEQRSRTRLTSETPSNLNHSPILQFTKVINNLMQGIADATNGIVSLPWLLCHIKCISKKINFNKLTSWKTESPAHTYMYFFSMLTWVIIWTKSNTIPCTKLFKS